MTRDGVSSNPRNETPGEILGVLLFHISGSVSIVTTHTILLLIY